MPKPGGYRSRSPTPACNSFSPCLSAAVTEDAAGAPAISSVPGTGYRNYILEELDYKLRAHHEELLSCMCEQLEGVKATLVEKLEKGASPNIQEQKSPTLARSKSKAEEKVHSSGRKSLLTLRSPQTVRTPEQTRSPSKDMAAGMDYSEHDSKLHGLAWQVSRENRTSFDESMADTEEPTKLYKFVHSPAFELGSTALIFTNAMFIGVQTEMASRGEDDSPAILAIGTAYTIVFALELLLRLFVDRCRFFKSRSHWHWNYLDAFLVFVSLTEATLEAVVRITGFDESQHLQDTSQFRMLRILRLTRLARGLKITRVLRFIRALRTLVNQIVFTMKAMMWAMLLLMMLLYVFALLFTQGATTYREEGGTLDGDPLASAWQDPLLQYWSTMPRAMFTLFKSITGGVSWEEVVIPLSDVGGFWVAAFIAYICFTQMAVLNVITGFFCQNAIESARLDQDLAAHTLIAEKRMYHEQITDIFASMDIDNSGSITIQEMAEHLIKEETRAYFESLGVDASDVWTLFKLMDVDRTSRIEQHEFIAGCMRLKGGAKGLDVAKLAAEHKYMSKQLVVFMERTDEALAYLLSVVRGTAFEEQ